MSPHMAAGTELDDLQRILQTQAILRFYEYKSSLFPISYKIIEIKKSLTGRNLKWNQLATKSVQEAR